MKQRGSYIYKQPIVKVEPFYKELGGRVRAIRRMKKYSMKDVAAMLNISYQQVQKYESGHNRIPIQAILSLCKQLDVSLDDFFDGIGDYESTLHSVLYSFDKKTLQVAGSLDGIQNHQLQNALFTLIREIAKAETKSL